MSSSAVNVERPLESPRPAPTRPSLDHLHSAIQTLDQRRLLVLTVFLTIASFDAFRPTDIDLWWHLKTGALIAQTHTVPMADPFSYTALGRPWVAHEWLWELAVYALTQLGGYRLAVLASSLVVTTTFVVIYRLLRQLGVNPLVATALVVWAALLAIPSLGVRPRELTFFFVAYYLNRLWLYREGKITRLWGLVPAMALWVNLHGLFILGLGLIGVFGLGALVHWACAQGKRPVHLIVVGGLTLAATALNPRGPAMLLYPVGYFLQRSNPSFSTVTEFQSPNFHDPLSLLLAGGIIVFMLVGLPRRGGITGVIFLVVFTLLALVSVRNAPLYAMVAAPLLALRLVERFAWGRELPPLRPMPRTIAFNWLLLGALLFLGSRAVTQPTVAARLQLGQEPLTTGLPVDGVRYITEHQLPGPVFNYQPWGGYLIDQWYPERRVFVDGRIDMYGQRIVQEYKDVVDVRPNWQQILDRYKVGTILTKKDSALATLLLADGQWQRVFHGKVDDVFVRRTIP